MSYEAPPGSLQKFITELTILEERVASLAMTRGLPKLRVYPMRQISQEWPAIYNWIVLSPGEWKDVSGHRHRLNLNLSVRIGVSRIDSDELTGRLLAYGDCVRDIFDAEFRSPQPLNNACKWADTPAMQFVAEDFGEMSFPVIEFQINAWLDRNVNPNP